MDDLEDLERTLRARLDAIGSAPRAVLHVLKLPDHERARRISDFCRDPRTKTFAKLLIDSRRVGSRSCRGIGRASGAGAAWARLDRARFRTFAESSAVGRIADGSGRRADAIVSASTDSGGSSEQDHHRRASNRHDVMSNTFLAGILVGLLMGGFIGTLAIALVAAGSTQRFPRSEARSPDWVGRAPKP